MSIGLHLRIVSSVRPRMYADTVRRLDTFFFPAKNMMLLMCIHYLLQESNISCENVFLSVMKVRVSQRVQTIWLQDRIGSFKKKTSV